MSVRFTHSNVFVVLVSFCLFFVRTWCFYFTEKVTKFTSHLIFFLRITSSTTSFLKKSYDVLLTFKLFIFVYYFINSLNIGIFDFLMSTGFVEL